MFSKMSGKVARQIVRPTRGSASRGVPLLLCCIGFDLEVDDYYRSAPFSDETAAENKLPNPTDRGRRATVGSVSRQESTGETDSCAGQESAGEADSGAAQASTSRAQRERGNHVNKDCMLYDEDRDQHGRVDVEDLSPSVKRKAERLARLNMRRENRHTPQRRHPSLPVIEEDLVLNIPQRRRRRQDALMCDGTDSDEDDITIIVRPTFTHL